MIDSIGLKLRTPDMPEVTFLALAGP